jgi:hypothetical protein
MKAPREIIEKRLDMIVDIYSIQTRIIGSIREHVAFTKVFTAEEIRVINLLDRSIPEKIGIVRNLKSFDFSESISNQEELKQIWENIMQLEGEQLLISRTLEVIRARIPKTEITPMNWVLSPHLIVRHLTLKIRIRVFNACGGIVNILDRIIGIKFRIESKMAERKFAKMATLKKKRNMI